MQFTAFVIQYHEAQKRHSCSIITVEYALYSAPIHISPVVTGYATQALVSVLNSTLQNLPRIWVEFMLILSVSNCINIQTLLVIDFEPHDLEILIKNPKIFVSKTYYEQVRHPLHLMNACNTRFVQDFWSALPS